MARTNLGACHEALGRKEEALAWYLEAVASSERIASPRYGGIALGRLAALGLREERAPGGHRRGRVVRGELDGTLAGVVAAAHRGNTLEGPVALVNGGPDCDAAGFGRQPMPMTGVAWAVVYDVDAISLDRNIYVQLDLTVEHEIWGEVDEDGVGNVRGPGESTLIVW